MYLHVIGLKLGVGGERPRGAHSIKVYEMEANEGRYKWKHHGSRLVANS
jgi:hypothetical protein